MSGWIIAASAHHAISLMCRLGGMMLCIPLFRDGVMTMRLKFAILAVISLSLLASGSIEFPANRTDLIEISPFTMASELLIGLILGWFVLLVFGAVRGACQLISTQLGLSGASVVDPLAGSTGAGSMEEGEALSRLYTSLAILVFLLLDLHHVLIESLASSFRDIPPGQLDIEAIPMLLQHIVVGTGPAVFVAATSLALPAIAAMFMVSLAQGVLGRMLPEAELLVLGIPLRIAFGLTVLVVSLPYSVDLIGGLLERALENGHEALRTAAVSGGF